MVFQEYDGLSFHLVQQRSRLGCAQGSLVVIVRVWVCSNTLFTIGISSIRHVPTFEKTECELGAEHCLDGVINIRHAEIPGADLV